MRYAIPSNVLYRDLPGEAVLLNLVNAEYFWLNDLGKTIWEALQTGADRQRIEETLCREYEAPAAQIHADLTTFLEHMRDLQLLTTSPE